MHYTLKFTRSLLHMLINSNQLTKMIFLISWNVFHVMMAVTLSLWHGHVDDDLLILHINIPHCLDLIQSMLRNRGGWDSKKRDDTTNASILLSTVKRNHIWIQARLIPANKLQQNKHNKEITQLKTSISTASRRSLWWDMYCKIKHQQVKIKDKVKIAELEHKLLNIKL